MFWYLIVVVGTIVLASLRWRKRKLIDCAKQFRSDIPCWPVLGHSYNFLGTDEDRMTTFKKLGLEAIKQDGITILWFATELYLILSDPELADTILKTCLEKDQHTMKLPRQVIGDGLIFAPVNIWRPRRKIAAPTFSMKNLNNFVQVFARQSDVLLEQLQPVADGRDISVWKYLTTFTFDVVCETMLGVQLNAQRKENPFIDALEAVFEEVGKRMPQPWLHFEAVYRLLPRAKRFEANKEILINFVDKIVRTKKQELAQREASNVTHDTNPDAKKGITKSFLELLIETSGGSQEGYDERELREEALVMLMAGTDTSATGASYAALMLSRYAEEQAKVYEEIQGVFGDSDRPLEVEDLPKLKYLEAFLKETLRMYPPVPVTTRAVHSDFVLPTGQKLVAGTRILLLIWAIHRNQHYWGEDVDQFRPERFLQPLRHPAQFVPFSYGMRNCLGYQYAMMSMKAVVATLVRRYRLLPPAGMPQEDLHKELRVQYDVMMRPVDDFVLRLEPRRSLNIDTKSQIRD